MPTTLKRNVVISGAISVATPHVYDEWDDVPKGLRSSGNWLALGNDIKKGEKPKAYVELDFGQVGLYERAQTYVSTEPKRSKWLLINRFIRRNEFFGLRPVGEDRPKRFDSSYLYGSVGNLVYKSFDYKKAHKGIATRIYREKNQLFADALYVLANEWTDWFVIDLDNHEPTKASTKAHLLLVHHLVRLMPRIVQRLGGGSVFYDYSQDSPKGIHIWVTLKRKMAVESLHHRVRAMLHEFADPDLDCLLQKNRLKEMGSIEILPTVGQLIRIFGTYDRRVFTTKELLPKDQMFDAEALLGHIESETTNGNPCGRYAQLAVAGLGNDACEAPVCVPVPPKMLTLASEKPSRKSGFFSHIVELCLNGVTEDDILFAGYLSPIAQALYWRDFHDRPDRASLTNDALVRWITHKHNGLVTRLNNGQRRLVTDQIRHVVKRLPKTSAGIRSFWSEIVANDLKYPAQKVSLVACIDAVVKNPIPVSKDTLRFVSQSLREGADPCTKGNTYNICSITPRASSELLESSGLPPAIEAELRSHLQRLNTRAGKPRERVVAFARNLIEDIGPVGTRTIAHARINQLAGLGHGRRHALRYKKLLVGAGILKPGWEKTYSKARKRASRYDLTPWALDELRKHVAGS